MKIQLKAQDERHTLSKTFAAWAADLNRREQAAIDIVGSIDSAAGGFPREGTAEHERRRLACAELWKINKERESFDRAVASAFVTGGFRS